MVLSASEMLWLKTDSFVTTEPLVVTQSSCFHCLLYKGTQGQCQDRHGAAERSVPTSSEAVQRVITGNDPQSATHYAPCWGTLAVLVSVLWTPRKFSSSSSFFFLQCGHFDFEFAVAAGQETQYLASILTGRLVQCISCNIHCALVKRREVKCYLDFHWVARPRRRTLTNGSDVKDVFPRCLLHSLYDQHWQQHWGRGALPHNGPWSEIRALPRTSRLLISNLRLRSYKPVSFFQVNWLEPSCALENGHFKQIQMQSL